MNISRPYQIVFPFVGDTIGGSHLSTLQLIEALPIEHAHCQIVLHQHGPFADYLGARNSDYKVLQGTGVVTAKGFLEQITQMATVAPRLKQYLCRQKADIVHTNDIRMHLTWAAAARLARCPHVWHQRSADNSRRLALFSKLSPSVIAISEYTRTNLASSLNARAVTINDPFDTDTKPPDRVESKRMVANVLGVPESTAIVGFIGNLTYQKRPIDFVKMSKLLSSKFPRNLAFPMIGEVRAETASHFFTEYQRDGGESTCSLLGPQYPIEPWLAGFDILVAPAINEGLGRVLIEAALVGTPVVAADDGGHREIVKHGVTGILTAPRNPVAMADAVLSLLEDKSRANTYSASARENVMQAFSIDRHVEKILEIYKQLGPRSDR